MFLVNRIKRNATKERTPGQGEEYVKRIKDDFGWISVLGLKCLSATETKKSQKDQRIDAFLDFQKLSQNPRYFIRLLGSYFSLTFCVCFVFQTLEED